MLKTYIVTLRLKEVARVEGKTLKGKKRNGNGADEEGDSCLNQHSVLAKLTFHSVQHQFLYSVLSS